MFKLPLAPLVMTACMAACASQRSSTAPETPPGAWSEFNGGEEDSQASSAPSTDMAESDEYDAQEVAPAEESEALASPAEDSGPEPAVRSVPAKKDCAGLEQKVCEITVGCAWSTEKVCLRH